MDWIPNDPGNPMLFPQTKKWFITALVAIATLAVAFVSSAYSGGIDQIIMEFRISQEIATLGLSLFVLGFAIGMFGEARWEENGMADGDMYRSSTLGSHVRTLRSTAPFLRHICCSDSLQRWRCRIAKFLDINHTPILRRCVW